jgi:hypothetical protein
MHHGKFDLILGKKLLVLTLAIAASKRQILQIAQIARYNPIDYVVIEITDGTIFETDPKTWFEPKRFSVPVIIIDGNDVFGDVDTQAEISATATGYTLRFIGNQAELNGIFATQQ